MKAKLLSIGVGLALLSGATLVMAEQVYTPPPGGGFGAGTSGGVGSSVSGGLNVGTIGNIIIFFSGTPGPGVRLGEPDVVVPMRDQDGRPIFVPISQVNLVIDRGGKPDNTLVIMHKGEEQIAVDAADVEKYKNQGWTEGAKAPTKVGKIEERDGVRVVVVPD